MTARAISYGGSAASATIVIVVAAVAYIIIVGIQRHHNGDHLILYTRRLAIAILGALRVVAFDARRRECQIVGVR